MFVSVASAGFSSASIYKTDHKRLVIRHNRKKQHHQCYFERDCINLISVAVRILVPTCTTVNFREFIKYSPKFWKVSPMILSCKATLCLRLIFASLMSRSVLNFVKSIYFSILLCFYFWLIIIVRKKNV